MNLDFAKTAIIAFIDNEGDQNAMDGLACTVAYQLLMKIQLGTLENLEPLQQAILDFCIKQELQAIEDRESGDE